MAIPRSLTVYTAICGKVGRDALRQPTGISDDNAGIDLNFVCFSDCLPEGPCGLWDVRRPVWEHEDPVRTARFHKIMSHELFRGVDATMWHDGSHRLNRDPRQLVSTVLAAGVEFATFKHPQRDCIYQELSACLKLSKDDAIVMQNQVENYRKLHMPENFGLFETACVIRRNCVSVVRLESHWWSHIVNGSRRDQLSLPFCLWQLGQIATANIPGCRDKSDFLQFTPHTRTKR